MGMKFYESGAKLAEDMGVALSVLEEETEKHYQASQKMEKDPDGGSWPAYPYGKSWDEASGKTGSGHTALLRRDHHSRDPLLHGRSCDVNRRRVHFERQSAARTLCGR